MYEVTDKVAAMDSEERRPSLFTALAKLDALRKKRAAKRAVSTESVDSQASFPVPSMQSNTNTTNGALSLKSVPSGKSMSSTVGPYKPSEMEPMELKQPQTLEEDDEEEEEGPPSPLSAVHGVTISLDSLKNGNLQLLKEYGDENDVDVNGTVTPPDDYPPDSTFPEHADNASV